MGTIKGEPRNSSNRKYYKTPKEVLEAFEAYKEELSKNPIKVHDFVGKDGDSVYRVKERPLTMSGFEVYCHKNKGEICHYFDNPDGRYEEYSTICKSIKLEIRQNQIEGGMAGIYNSSITQRLNSLTEKTETTIKEQPLFGDEE